jgi:aminopeptidase N
MILLSMLLGLLTSPLSGTETRRDLPDTYPKNSDLDVEHYSFDLVLSDTTDVIRGVATVRVRYVTPGYTALRLDFVEESDALEGRGMTVDGIRMEGGDLAYSHEEDQLFIDLGREIGKGEAIEISVAYHGIPATGLQIGPNKHGDRTFFSDNWPNRARNWLPTIDHPYDKATSEMRVTAPSRYQVVSNGLRIEETDVGDGTRITHWKQSVPIATWLYVLGVAEFAIQYVDDFDGKSIETWVYRQDRDAGFHDFAVPTKDVLEFYSDKVGPYSYEKLANIQSNSVGGGMEAASAIFYGDDSVTGDRSLRWRNVVIHEIAHQWFGNAVTEYDWNDVWLSEGFATYFTLLYREHAYGRDDFVEGLGQARDRVFDFYEDRFDYRIVHENLDDMRQVTTGMTYQKGAWVLHMLRRAVGTEAFWQGVSTYYNHFRDRNATTADFRRFMEEASGHDLESFFRQWLYQGGVPTIEASWGYDPDSGEVTIDLAQTQGSYAFALDVDADIVLDDGSRRTRVTAELKPGADASLRVAVPNEPVEVRIDPDTWLLARWNVTRREPGSP